MAQALAVVSPIITVISGFQQASAQEAAGERAQKLAEMQAQQTRDVAERNTLIARDSAAFKSEAFKAKGIQEQASSQREFLERRRQTRITESRATAVAGASGGGVGDPTMLDIYGGIEQEGEFAAQTALFEGDSAASLLNSQAALALYEGEQRAKMTEFTGEQQSDLQIYQGDVARYDSKVQAINTRTAAIGKAVDQASSGLRRLTAKYAPQGGYDANVGSQGASSSYFPKSGETVYWS